MKTFIKTNLYYFFIALLCIAIASSCKKKKEIIVHPVIAPITEAVFASGHIEAADQFTLTAMNEGYIQEVLVQEGENVATNTLLFKQDNASQLIQQQTAKKNLDIAQKNAEDNSALLQQLNVQLLAAKDKLNNDSIQAQRLNRLFATHSVAKVDVENAQLAYTTSVNNVAALEKSIAKTKTDLQQTIINNAGQYATAVVNNSYFSIRSPGNYTVFKIIKKKGELARRADPLAIMGSKDSLLAVMNVDEISIDKIKENQQVLIELNTEKGKAYKATVKKIYPIFDSETQSYRVDAWFDSFPPHLINGTLFQANIIIQKKNQAMLIPKDALIEDNKVLLKHGKNIDTLTIQIGIISNEWVEVLSGLKTTDQLITQEAQKEEQNRPFVGL